MQHWSKIALKQCPVSFYCAPAQVGNNVYSLHSLESEHINEPLFTNTHSPVWQLFQYLLNSSPVGMGTATKPQAFFKCGLLWDFYMQSTDQQMQKGCLYQFAIQASQHFLQWKMYFFFSSPSIFKDPISALNQLASALIRVSLNPRN